MAKTSASFNLSKTTKRVASTILDKNQRSNFIKLMTDAEHSYVVNRHKRTPREKEAPKDE